MHSIDPSIVVRLRQERHWTQADLASRARINKQSVSRLERGETTRVRLHTLNSLCKAFGVEAGVLTGEKALPAKSRPDLPWETRSLISVRMSDSSRNALTLAAKRYAVAPAQIVEVAPFLFTWAAEMSLRRRADRLVALEQRLSAAAELQRDFPHLSAMIAYYPQAEDVISAERDSVAAKDLFGEKLDPEGHGGIVDDDFDEETEGPFVAFLRDRASEMDPPANFARWSRYFGPTYQVCSDEAAGLVGGDADLAEAILSGEVALHKMPAELRRSEGMSARLDWMREEAEATRQRLSAALGEIEKLLEDVVYPQPEEQP